VYIHIKRWSCQSFGRHIRDLIVRIRSHQCVHQRRAYLAGGGLELVTLGVPLVAFLDEARPHLVQWPQRAAQLLDHHRRVSRITGRLLRVDWNVDWSRRSAVVLARQSTTAPHCINHSPCIAPLLNANCAQKCDEHWSRVQLTVKHLHERFPLFSRVFVKMFLWKKCTAFEYVHSTGHLYILLNLYY